MNPAETEISPKPAPVFLSAEWRQLAMVNYVVDPAVLLPLLPAGTELDTFEGRSYVSLVGFLFLETRVFGFRFPFHTNFEEVNLRFYVRRQTGGAEGWRRGTVFIREMVPRWIIATMASLIYNEPYLARPMRHTVEITRAQYDWRHGGRWQSLSVAGEEGDWQQIAAGSEEEFITEHYWVIIGSATAGRWNIRSSIRAGACVGRGNTTSMATWRGCTVRGSCRF